MRALSFVIFTVALACASASLLGISPLATDGNVISAYNVPRAASVGLGRIALPSTGLGGQWVPDINEALYDDGSFKPLIYGL